jgi:hypothetical protein
MKRNRASFSIQCALLLAIATLLITACVKSTNSLNVIHCRIYTVPRAANSDLDSNEFFSGDSIHVLPTRALIILFVNKQSRFRDKKSQNRDKHSIARPEKRDFT